MVAISSAVLKWAKSHPDRTALNYAGQNVTYSELAQRVQRTAGMLRAQGVGQGDVGGQGGENRCEGISFRVEWLSAEARRSEGSLAQCVM